jgi:hypothetical protein
MAVDQDVNFSTVCTDCWKGFNTSLRLVQKYREHAPVVSTNPAPNSVVTYNARPTDAVMRSKIAWMKRLWLACIMAAVHRLPDLVTAPPCRRTWPRSMRSCAGRGASELATQDAVQKSGGLGVCKPVGGRQIALISLGSRAASYYPAGIRCGIGRIGWHTFRNTLLTLLDETGAPMKVQQELMRHADIRTTMNVYGKAMDESKRAAHGKVIRLVLPSKVA